jgi:hypothetical protein
MTSMKDLKAKGGIVSSVPIKKEIKFKLDGDDEFTASIFVKKLAIGDYESLFLVDNEDRSRTAKIISEAVTLGDDGKEKISFKDAYQLHPALAGAMIVAFNEVNAAKKSSAPATASSAN